MPGHATHADALPALELGNAYARTQRGPLSVLDSRPTTQFTGEEQDAALAALAKKAGPATAGIVERVNTAFELFRAELNASAGGRASDRVMLMAHTAQRAQLAVELQTSVATVAHGHFVDESDSEKRQEVVSKNLRNLVGICAFATDLLTKAHTAAVEEGKVAKGSETAQLLTAIGYSADQPNAPVGSMRTHGSLDTQVLHVPTGSQTTPCPAPAQAPPGDRVGGPSEAVSESPQFPFSEKR